MIKSVLANGAVVFVYKLRNNLDLGIGGGLTNSYGIPMILPMIYFSWRNTGKYELKVDMSSGIKISAATWLNKKFKVELTAIEMDGMSAVMSIDGKSKIYSTVSMKSYISPSFYISKKTSIYLGIGGNWIRSAKISDRSFKALSKTLKKTMGAVISAPPYVLRQVSGAASDENRHLFSKNLHGRIIYCIFDKETVIP